MGIGCLIVTSLCVKSELGCLICMPLLFFIP